MYRVLRREVPAHLRGGKRHQTVAADQSIFPFGTVLYIEGVGVRVVQDKGSGIQGKHLDVAVSGTHEDALAWSGYGKHKVWVMKEVNENDGE